MERIAANGLAALCLILMIGCSKPPRETGESAVMRAPVALLVEQVVDRSVLGLPLREPFGLAADHRGMVYVVDAGNNRLVRFASDMKADRETSGFGASGGLLDRPSFVTLDNDLNLFVSDAGNRRVCRFDAELNYVSEIELSDEDDPLMYGEPSGLALTDYGELWLADHDKSQLAVFDNIGGFDRVIGDFGYSGGQLAKPEKVLADPGRDAFIVCDAGNARLVTYDFYGNFDGQIKHPEFEYPIAATPGEIGGLWVLDNALGRVMLFDAAGRSVFATGPLLAGSNVSLKSPSDILSLRNDRLLIADTGNNRLVICRILYNE